MTRRPPRLLPLCVAAAVLALALAGWGTLAAPARSAVPRPPSRPLMGIASSRYLDRDPGRLLGVGARWSYDWSPRAPRVTRGLEWVPMVWGAGSVTPTTLAALAADRRTGRAHVLLGFNEPDNGGQANMSPEQAAALWPALQRTGLALASPAVATPDDGWLASFMALVRRRHLRVDVIALHIYPDVTAPDAVDGLRRELLAVHAAYHRPIWITELGALDLRSWGEPMAGPLTPGAAERFLRAVIPMLGRLGFVQRVAWFTDGCWNDPGCHASSLWNGAGVLTGLGRTFRALAAR